MPIHHSVGIARREDDFVSWVIRRAFEALPTWDRATHFRPALTSSAGGGSEFGSGSEGHQ